MTLSELQQAHRAIGPQWFAAADLNKDGRLNSHEYSKALARDFDQADTDTDNTLSMAEYKGM